MFDAQDIIVEMFDSNHRGGQKTNGPMRGIRITHKKTGVSVSCESERSSFENKAMALDQLEEVLRGINK